MRICIEYLCMCISRIFYDISYVFQYPCPSTHIGSLDLSIYIYTQCAARITRHRAIVYFILQWHFLDFRMSESRFLVTWLFPRIPSPRRGNIDFWDVRIMIFGNVGGPGTYFGDPGPHFEDFRDYCDFGSVLATKT